MKPGARIGDNHTCPQQTPVPHGGGPIRRPGAPTVFLEHLVGSVLGDECICASGMDATAEASGTVFYEGKHAVRMGDKTAHGGVIVEGASHVFVGG